MAIKEVRVAYLASDGRMIILKEVVGAKVRRIGYEYPIIDVHKFDATDGSLKPTYLNLSSCVWFEIDEDDSDASS